MPACTNELTILDFSLQAFFFQLFFFLMIRRPPSSTRLATLFPYTTLFRSVDHPQVLGLLRIVADGHHRGHHRSEEHTSELQSQLTISYAVFCVKKKKKLAGFSRFAAGGSVSSLWRRLRDS